MIAGLLGDIVTPWPEALQSGAVTLTTIKEEPRLIAEGSLQETVLLGFRTSESRYLDVYPGVPLHVVAYPYEAEVDDKIQQRIHASIESLQENGPRTIVLKQLQLSVPNETAPQEKTAKLPRSKRPETRRRFEVQARLQQRRFVNEDCVEPLDLGRIVGQHWFDEITVAETSQSQGGGTRSLEQCEITDTMRDRYRFPIGRLVDVFRPATEQQERIAAADLEPGMLMVILVDDPYEDVFQRMLEAIRERRDIGAKLALELWGYAKPAALTKYGGNRTRLHRALEANGLSVEYQAVVGWYRSGKEEILAPLQREDFEILARASGIYSDLTRIAATFNCIQHERIVRRTCGRQLSKLLSQLAAGKHYEAALKSADAIGTALEQVAAAVSLREVESVKRLGKGIFSGKGAL